MAQDSQPHVIQTASPTPISTHADQLLARLERHKQTTNKPTRFFIPSGSVALLEFYKGIAEERNSSLSMVGLFSLSTLAASGIGFLTFSASEATSKRLSLLRRKNLPSAAENLTGRVKFFNLVKAMREAQREYFSTRSHEALQKARSLERSVDAYIKRGDDYFTKPRTKFIR